jgi:CBS domain-containing protein
METIESLMATELIEATPEESIRDVAIRMSHNKVGAVVVKNADGLYGIFSERDLGDRVVGAGRDPDTTSVGDVATRHVVTIDVAQPVREVLDVFRDKGFRHLPVTRGGEAVGILSTRDFLAQVVDGLESFIEKNRYTENIAEGSDPYDHMGGAYGR